MSCVVCVECVAWLCVLVVGGGVCWLLVVVCVVVGGLLFFVLETIRTGAMRVVHIPVKTEETQRLRIKFVLYCLVCAFNLRIKRAI